MFNRKFILIYLILLAILLIGVILINSYFFPSNLKGQEFDIREFEGTIVSIDDNSMTLKGRFASELSLPESILEVHNFSFKINKKEVSFQKEEIIWPSREELRAKSGGASSGVINSDDLIVVKGAGSFDDLNKYFASEDEGVWVRAYFSSSIQNSNNPSVSSIYYEVITWPK